MSDGNSKVTETGKAFNNDAIQAVRPNTGHRLASVSSGVSATAAFGSSTNLIRVCSDQPMWLDIGSSPSATSASGLYLPAGVPEYFVVSPGDSLAAVNSSTSGSCYIKEC